MGLVPTMGALHQGHLALVSRALEENTIVVVSIFVNPAQFNKAEDLNKYPKTLAKDLELLEALSDRIVVFNPEVSEMYPKGSKGNSYDFGGLEKVMEGEFRPGHFEGVGTIVEALLKLVLPDRAYFGEKDFQQLQIVRKMVSLKKITTQIVGCPIVREPHGLAMSSRNERLSASTRVAASFIYETLVAAKEAFRSKSASSVIQWVKKRFESHSLFTLEYIDIRTVKYLKPVKRKHKNGSYRAFIAVYADGVRLIDNIAL